MVKDGQDFDDVAERRGREKEEGKSAWSRGKEGASSVEEERLARCGLDQIKTMFSCSGRYSVFEELSL